MTKKTIAIDIDDVTADSTESLRLLVNQRFKVNLTKDHYKLQGSHRRYYERVWATNNLNEEVQYATFEAEMEEDQSHVPIIDGAKEAIEHLKETYKVIFITSRYPSWDRATRKWLQENFTDDMDVHFSEGYGNGQTQTKGQLCREFGAEWLIDDVPSNCQSALDEGVGAILFGDYGWHYDRPDGMLHCKDWRAVLDFFDGKS